MLDATPDIARRSPPDEAAVTPSGEASLFSPGTAFAAVFVIWMAVSLIAGVTAFLAMGGRGFGDLSYVMQPMLRYYGVWFVCSLLIYQVVLRFRGSAKKWAAGFGIHLLLLSGLTLTLPFVVSPNNWPDMLHGQRAPGFHSLSVIVYSYCLVGAFVLRRYRVAERLKGQAAYSELQAVVLENQLNLARIDALKMQINPHFLFNAFNSIAALIEARRNDDAYEALGLLGDLLRTAMTHASDRFVSLDDELTFVRRYIAVERLRFGDRLELVENVAESSLLAEVPALLLQPIVENAIKHALARRTEAVRIEVSARSDGNRLVLSVLDNGPGFADTGSAGIGLVNVERRLRLLFQDNAELRCENDPSGGAHVSILLPLASDAAENAAPGIIPATDGPR